MDKYKNMWDLLKTIVEMNANKGKCDIDYSKISEKDIKEISGIVYNNLLEVMESIENMDEEKSNG